MNQPPSSQNVITLLQAIQPKLPNESLLAFICLPNVILSLAGTRGFGDGVFYSEDSKQRDTWCEEITEVMDELNHFFPLRYSVGVDSNYSNKTYIAFSFLNIAIAIDTLAMYRFLSEEDRETFKRQFDQTKGFIQQLSPILRQKTTLFKGWADEAIDAIAQGILLGYPEKAITQTVPLITSDYETYTSLNLVSARIGQATRYVCPVPIYDYPRSLRNDTSIIEHEMKWSTILDGFYASDFFQALDNAPAFRAKLKEIGANR